MTAPTPADRCHRALGLCLALAALIVGVGQTARAQSMIEVAEICSDPMTTGPQKLPRLAAAGWVQGDGSNAEAINLLATAQIATFTAGMTDWAQRYGAIPELAGNLTNMINGGSVTLWTRQDAILAVSIQPAPESGEHLACYFAGPEHPETLELIARYGTPETIPEQNLTILRFDESAFVMDPAREYRMYSVFSRHQSSPEFTHPDAYRLERITEPDAQ